MPGIELFGSEEIAEVNDVLETGILFRYGHEEKRQQHWKAKSFEEEVKKITQAPFAHAVSSGSAAISTAMAAAGIGTGDEVIVPPFTFIATIEAVLFLGAIPIFAEIDETLCLSAEGIEQAITPRTKAVCLVHMCGAAAEMNSIMQVIEKHQLILVEDAGQAFGASFQGTATGLFGKAGSYSFDFFKIATAGEGGVCVCNDEAVYNIMDAYSDHGHTHAGHNRGMEPHPILGFNYRISELHAAVALAQCKKVPQIIKINQAHKNYLQQQLQQIEGLTLAVVADSRGDSATFLNLLFTDAEKAQKVVDYLKNEGVGGFNYWYTNMYHFINQWDHLKNMKTASKLFVQHINNPPNYHQIHLPKSQEVIGRLVSFSISCQWQQNDLDALVASVKKAVSTF